MSAQEIVMSTRNSRREFIHAAGLTGAGLLASAPLAAQSTAASAATGPAPAQTMGAKFRALLQKRDPFEAVAAYDVFTARMVEEMGFPALCLGGSLVGDFFGEPDWQTTLPERVAYARQITERVDIPAMVDIDDGGDAMSVYRATKQFEHARVGAIHLLDDAVGPMGQTTGVIPTDKMVDKIHAAVDARSDLVVTVRCTAATNAGKETKEQAIARGVAYAEAGAETIWFMGMPFADLPAAAAAVKVPITSQLFMDTPMSAAKTAKVTVAVYASLLQNIAQSAVYDALTELKTTGLMTKSAGAARLGSRIPAELRARIMRNADVAARGRKYRL
jgi:2-methylisocitrate lyase-like PEP mutase family enzyme